MTAADGKIIPFPGAPGHGRLLRLRVELLLAPEPVWRRLEVPASATFWDLHVAITDAFGWRGGRLHQFTVDDPASGATVRFGIPGDDTLPGSEPVQAGWDHRPARYLRRDTAPALYVHDFGADWQHAVELEAAAAAPADARLPRCTGGAGRPPTGDGEVAAAAAGPFEPADVTFRDPRRQWRRRFGHD